MPKYENPANDVFFMELSCLDGDRYESRVVFRVYVFDWKLVRVIDPACILRYKTTCPRKRL
jgi:hypothetical protein